MYKDKIEDYDEYTLKERVELLEQGVANLSLEVYNLINSTIEMQNYINELYKKYNIEDDSSK